MADKNAGISARVACVDGAGNLAPLTRDQLERYYEEQRARNTVEVWISGRCDLSAIRSIAFTASTYLHGRPVEVAVSALVGGQMYATATDGRSIGQALMYLAEALEA